ncbi:hypothetical protein B6V73_00005, partial [Thioclava sp. JM3]
DLDDLSQEFGTDAQKLLPCLTEMATRFAPFARLTGKRISIAQEGRPLTRMIASVLDQYVPEGVRYSRAS